MDFGFLSRHVKNQELSNTDYQDKTNMILDKAQRSTEL